MSSFSLGDFEPAVEHVRATIALSDETVEAPTDLRRSGPIRFDRDTYARRPDHAQSLAFAGAVVRASSAIRRRSPS